MPMISSLSTGDRVRLYQKSLVVEFVEKRSVLSTSPFNGGYREDLVAVFNNDCNPGEGKIAEMRAPTYEAHMRLIAAELGLDPDRSAGLSTAASMENAAVKSECYEDLTVTAIVTGGIEINGGRVGDPASYHERKGQFEPLRLGTINIILVIDAKLPPGTLTRALVTCTEAKTAALQELMAGSNYSHGLATGSGTDGTILVCRAESGLVLTDAGKHAKLGELIGRTVKGTVKEALLLQTGLCPVFQHDILRRVKRYGIDEDTVFERYKKEQCGQLLQKSDFSDRLHELSHDRSLIAAASLYAHLLDQLDWALLEPDETGEMGAALAQMMAKKINLCFQWQKICGHTKETVMTQMVENFSSLLAAGAAKTKFLIED